MGLFNVIIFLSMLQKQRFYCACNLFALLIFQVLQNHLGQLKDKNKTIITCCASGMRSASAKSILKSNGYTSVHNGGGWSSLQSKL